MYNFNGTIFAQFVIMLSKLVKIKSLKGQLNWQKDNITGAVLQWLFCIWFLFLLQMSSVLGENNKYN